MKFKKGMARLLCAAMLAAVLTACGNSSLPKQSRQGKAALKNYHQNDKKLTAAKDQWQYDSVHSVWYQLGVTYCANPTSKNQTITAKVLNMKGFIQWVLSSRK